MPIAVPVPDGEPDVAVPAFDAGEAAEILALVSGLLAAEPEAGTAAARFLAARGADPLPALGWLAEGAGRWPGSWMPRCRMRASPATASWTVTGGGRRDRQ